MSQSTQNNLAMIKYDAAKILGLNGSITPQTVLDAAKQKAKKYDSVSSVGKIFRSVIGSAYTVLKDFSGKLFVNQKDSHYSEKLANALEIACPMNLHVEIDGAWIWVSGHRLDQYKAQLLKAGFHYSKKKNMYYFRPQIWKSSSRGQTPIENIRSKFGTIIVQEEDDTKTNPMVKENGLRSNGV